MTSLIHLAELRGPGWNNYPSEPIVSINPTASTRQLKAAIECQLKGWKDERKLSDQRDRSDKYADYLEVWDLREGWTGSTYDRAREQRMKQIALSVKRSIPTVSSQYQSAFEIITGYPYSPEMWARIIGPRKISGLWEGATGWVSRHRPLKSRSAQPVPESRLNAPLDALGAISTSDNEMVNLVLDIQSLIDRGSSDQEILENLELPSEATDLVAYFREHSASKGPEPSVKPAHSGSKSRKPSTPKSTRKQDKGIPASKARRKK